MQHLFLPMLCQGGSAGLSAHALRHTNSFNLQMKETFTMEFILSCNELILFLTGCWVGSWVGSLNWHAANQLGLYFVNDNFYTLILAFSFGIHAPLPTSLTSTVLLRTSMGIYLSKSLIRNFNQLKLRTYQRGILKNRFSPKMSRCVRNATYQYNDRTRSN